MEQRFLHIVLRCLLMSLGIGLASCIDDSGPFSDDDYDTHAQECLLTLNVSSLESRDGIGKRESVSHELMHGLRVVVLDQPDGTVEFNRHYDLDEGGTSFYGTIVVPVKPGGTKFIYLIANEESAGELIDSGTEGATLADLLGSAAVGSRADDFITDINNAVFAVPETSYGGTRNIPMSAVYRIETSAADSGTRKDCGTLHIVRTVTKYSFSFRNDRVSGQSVYVKSWEISNIVIDRAYLMPHFSAQGDCWGYYFDRTNGWSKLGAGWTATGKEWLEWLAGVSDQSNADPNQPSADESGWLTCYDIPEGAATGKLTHEYAAAGLEIPIDGQEHDGVATKYAPESKSGKSSDCAFVGEQQYFVNLVVTEGNDSEEHSFAAPIALPNLRSLFRNTHVRVQVRFGQTMKDDVIYAKIVDWTIWGRKEGELKPE